MIKVAIADDQMLLREMLSMVLTAEDGIEVVGLAGDGEEIIGLCRETNPDLVLLDLKMPGSGGIHALEAIKKEMPHIKAVMLTTFGDEKSVLEAFGKGADGYVLKDIKPEPLAMAVKCAYHGLFVMQEGVASLEIGRAHV
jgi:DNA-binding NarL/FixJ family response regulator